MSTSVYKGKGAFPAELAGLTEKLVAGLKKSIPMLILAITISLTWFTRQIRKTQIDWSLSTRVTRVH
ncbi:MAG: hypothetical protein JRG94_01450 [Deltaproteobacteria bacterium]|nr:hypothetical protein [Deltaproteobacteria bacterium]